MHPIERLRYVARAEGAPQAAVVAEAARALTAFGDDPAGMVMAVQRLVAHHPTLGAMWWMGARALCAPHPAQEAFTASEEVEDDATAYHLARALDPDATVVVAGWPPVLGEALGRRGTGRVLVVDTGREAAGLHRSLDRSGVDVLLVPMSGAAAAVAEASLVLVECQAGGPSEALVDGFGGALAAIARTLGVEVWAAVGVGRMLPTRMWEALVARWERLDEPWELDEDRIPWDLVDRVAGPDGLVDVHAVASLITAPVAPELLR